MGHYKWIAREIASLDPEVDYERIMRLSYTYYPNDFVMNLYYTLIFPYDLMPPNVSEAVYRAGTGKVVKRGQKRADDTFTHFWAWFDNGPSSPVTRKSVAMVNNIHNGVAKSLKTGNFSHVEDFTYTLCNMAVELHRLRLRIGMTGFTENQKMATTRFFGEMSKLFVTENGESGEFPDSFDAILAYCEAHEAKPWPHTDTGRWACEAIFGQFVDRWFPKPLRALGHTTVLSLQGEPPRRVHQLPRPREAQERLVKQTFRAVLTLQEKVLPDPQVSAPEIARRRAARRMSRVPWNFGGGPVIIRRR